MDKRKGTDRLSRVVAMAVAAAFPPGTLLPTKPSTHLAPITLRFRNSLHPPRAAVVAAAATLREVCAGRVPDHVLQR